MRVFVINLDRLPERMQRMERLLQGLDLTCERIAAVDGRMLSPETVQAWPVQPGADPPRPDELGCLLSHRKCWELIADGDDASAIVLEDDLVFASNAATLLQRADLLSPDADMIRLEAWPAKIRVSIARTLLTDGYVRRRLYIGSAGSAAYVISRTYAKWLLLHLRIWRGPLDLVLFGADMCAERKVFTVMPGPCCQYQHLAAQIGNLPYLASTIEHMPYQKPRRNVAGKVFAEVMRTALWISLRLRARMERSIALHPSGPAEEPVMDQTSQRPVP